MKPDGRTLQLITDQHLTQKLQWVDLSDAAKSELHRFPNFLILGPQRTGTTWLHAQLRYHPQIFLTEPKELYFFSSLKGTEPSRFEGREVAKYLRCFRDSPHWFIRKSLSAIVKHGEIYRPIVRGEATASYAALDEDLIEEIVYLRPDLKVILMIRDPIERAWSHVKKDLARSRGRRIEQVPAHEIYEFLSNDYQRRCARSVEQYDRWSAKLLRGHVFVGQFNDVERRPRELLQSVMSFLGVRSDSRYIPVGITTAVNRTAKSPIPEHYLGFLNDLLGPDKELTQRRFEINW